MTNLEKQAEYLLKTSLLQKLAHYHRIPAGTQLIDWAFLNGYITFTETTELIKLKEEVFLLREIELNNLKQGK